MKIFTVHELVNAGKSVQERADNLVFIKDGFAVFAVISPALWFIWHKLWLPLIVYSGVIALLMGASMAFGLDDVQFGILSSLLNLGIGLEANNIRRWFLERGGARTIGVVSGHNLEECEYRFFASWFDFPEPEKSLVARLETA